MAFEAAAGHGNLPQGNWSPVIYSKKVLKFFRTTSVAEEVTNTDYEGEIKQMGDTVKIMKEPVITTKTYKRGTKIDYQDLTDEDLSLTIDQAEYFGFLVEDIEAKMSHIGWAGMAQVAGAYALRDSMDSNVLQAMYDGSTTTAGTGTDASAITVGYGNGNTFTPINLLNRLARLLDENDVPEEGRFYVGTPEFYEALGDEDGKYIDASVMGDPVSALRMRKLARGKEVAGFTLWKSNNLPIGASNSSKIMLAGHISSTGTATSIIESETLRSQDTFADLYRGLMVWGRKVLRPEGLISAAISSFADA